MFGDCAIIVRTGGGGGGVGHKVKSMQGLEGGLELK